MKLFYHYPFYFRLKRGFSSIPVVKTAYFPNKQKVAAFSINRGGTHEENRSGYDRSPREPKKGTRKSKKEKKRRLRQPAFTPELDTGDTDHGPWRKVCRNGSCSTPSVSRPSATGHLRQPFIFQLPGKALPILQNKIHGHTKAAGSVIRVPGYPITDYPAIGR